MNFTRQLTILILCTILSQTSQAQCWNLVFEEEFDGTSLDLTTWEYQVGGGWGNNEFQYYTNGANVEASGGTLKIITKEDVTNQYPSNGYTLSRVRTINKADFRYGRM